MAGPETCSREKSAPRNINAFPGEGHEYWRLPGLVGVKPKDLARR
jgi:hypothetical protein